MKSETFVHDFPEGNILYAGAPVIWKEALLYWMKSGVGGWGLGGLP